MITGNVNNPPIVDNLSATRDGLQQQLLRSDPEGIVSTFSIVGQPLKVPRVAAATYRHLMQMQLQFDLFKAQ